MGKLGRVARKLGLKQVARLLEQGLRPGLGLTKQWTGDMDWSQGRRKCRRQLGRG